MSAHSVKRWGEPMPVAAVVDDKLHHLRLVEQEPHLEVPRQLGLAIQVQQEPFDPLGYILGHRLCHSMWCHSK